ncbi:hypothetical protein D6C79_09530 [Aureobasidium pullulans]|nr:hypothetical protein D6C79_09530 [Aureobasidium pullulans]
MPPKPLLKRKRSSADSSLSQEAKRVLRPRAAPQTFTPIQIAPVVKARVKKTIANRSAPLVKPKAYSPGSNLLLQKDKIIEQLRLDLADAKSKLSKTQKREEDLNGQDKRYFNRVIAKTYKDAIKALETALKSLDAKVRKMSPNSRTITTDTYADMASKHLKAVNALEKMDKGLVYAFNMAMAVADASHTDCDTTPKMGGFGDSEGPFGEMDGMLVGLIERRNVEGSAKRQEGLPAVRKRWTRADGDVGEFKTGRPNKQQYGQLQRQKLAWENERREEKRERRESVDDWVTVALQDLKEERDYLAEYGVEKYFPKSIARLEELLGSEANTAAGAGDAA